MIYRGLARSVWPLCLNKHEQRLEVLAKFEMAISLDLITIVAVDLKFVMNSLWHNSGDYGDKKRELIEHICKYSLLSAHIVVLKMDSQHVLVGASNIYYDLDVKIEKIGPRPQVVDLGSVLVASVVKVCVVVGRPLQQIHLLLANIHWKQYCLACLSIKETVADASVLPQEIVGVPDVVLESFLHKVRFSHDNGVVEIETELRMLA